LKRLLCRVSLWSGWFFQLKCATQQAFNSSTKVRPKKIFSYFLFILLWQNTDAQEISFFHLNTSNGLSDNNVHVAVRDKNGLLWIGTANGLNCFDGYTVKQFFKEQHSEMGSNNINSIICDDRNRLWLGSPDSKVCMMDENRVFRKINVTDSGRPASFFYQVKTKEGVLYKNGARLYKIKDTTNLLFERVPWQEDEAINKPFTKWGIWGENKVVFIGANSLCVFDTEQLKVLLNLHIPDIAGAEKINETEALVTSEKGSPLSKISLEENRITKNYSNLTDQYGDKINSSLRGIKKMADGRIIMTSGYAGVYVFDASTEKLFRYAHDPLNNRTVSANNTFYTYADSNGYCFITTLTAGLNYFNINLKPAAYLPAFADANKGTVFDGHVNAIAEAPDGNIWLGTQSRLIEWHKKNNSTRFYNYGTVDGVELNGNENIRSLCFDRNERLWIGTARFGITVLDKNKRPLKYFLHRNDSSANALSSDYINQIILSPASDSLWVATISGLCMIDGKTLAVSRQLKHPLFSRLQNVPCNTIWFSNSNEVWVATDTGAWRWRMAENELDSFTVASGLSDNRIICFTKDNAGNIYAGTASGLNRIDKADKIKIFSKGSGLQNEKCESLLTDKKGNIWIANSNCVIQFDSYKEIFTVYDESVGISNTGFRQNAGIITLEGSLIWGTYKGINWFYPESLQQLRVPLKVMINSFLAGNKNLYATVKQQSRVTYADNTLLFTFSAIDLCSSKNIQYQYRLKGTDDNWITATAPQQVIYSKLWAGTYSFEVRASRNGEDWINAANNITIQIQPPWWGSWWFITVCVLLTGWMLTSSFIKRNKKIIRQKEALETEKAINWFATSLNEKNSVEDILWDVTRNCISHLKFEDCVIYVADAERKVLIQKAAWGPKTTDENKILNPIEIPFGEGITGTVAKTGKAEIIADTTKDKRYIVDDASRLSEICVPIIADGNLLGVIDSEHSRKNFFTAKHLSILTTIASLCAVKILRSVTEEEKRQAQEELQYMQQRAVETEMLALRAQMNPHFMFNSLNSINNFILKNDTDKASEYLTRFSQLMRMILDNSRQEWVLLENELKALQLYMELEAVRLKNIFAYSVSIDQNIQIASLQVPPMIIQPYIENAIWHGLLHRQEHGGLLQLTISNHDNCLQIMIEDNGIGRKESAQMKSKYQGHKKSHGMQITAERIDIINKIYPVHVSVNVEDIIKNNTVAGTRVLLVINRNGKQVEE
jgi:ligand-binding sensor domain-containing protein/putative methionine-R-sulfoxide reductase with GAF domain